MAHTDVPQMHSVIIFVISLLIRGWVDWKVLASVFLVGEHFILQWAMAAFLLSVFAVLLPAFQLATTQGSHESGGHCFASFFGRQVHRETNSFTFAPPPCSTAAICFSKLKSNCCMLCFAQSDISGYHTQLTAIGNWKYIIWVLNTFGLPFWLSAISYWELQMPNQGVYGHISGARDLPQTFAATCESSPTLQNFFDQGFTLSDCLVRTLLSGTIP